MKLHITHTDNIIQNYNNVTVQNGIINLSNVVNNSCDEILVIDALDYVKYENVNKTLASIMEKLRINGTITIVGTDLRSFNRLILSEKISIEEYNKKIEDVKSLNYVSNVRKILDSYGLAIESEMVRSHKYEIVAIRKYNENKI